MAISALWNTLWWSYLGKLTIDNWQLAWPVTFLKRDSCTAIFLWRTYSESLIYIEFMASVQGFNRHNIFNIQSIMIFILMNILDFAFTKNMTNWIKQVNSEAHLGLLQHSRWNTLWQKLTISTKSSIFDVAAVLDPPL